MSPLDIVENKITELMRAADEASAPSSRPGSTPGSRSVSRPSSRPSSRSSCDPRVESRSQPCSSSGADGSNDGMQWDRRMLHPLDAARYGSPGCADSRDWMHGARSPYRDDMRQQRSPRSAVPSSHYAYSEDSRVMVSVADHSQASTPTSSMSHSAHSPSSTCHRTDRTTHSPHVSPDSYMHSPRGGAYMHAAPDSRGHLDNSVDSRRARSPKYRQVAAAVPSQSPPDNLVSGSSDRQACGSSVRVTPGGATTWQHHTVDRCQSSHDHIDELSTSNLSPRSADSPQSDKMVIDETPCSADSSASSIRFPIPSSTPSDSSRPLPSHTGGATFMDVDSQSSACSSEVDRVTQSNSRCSGGEGSHSGRSPQPSTDTHGGVDSSQYAQYAVISSGSMRRSPQLHCEHASGVVSSLSGSSAKSYSSSASRMMYSALSMPTSSQQSHSSPSTSSPSTTPPAVTGTSSGHEPSPLLSSQYETLTDEDD